MTTYIDILTSYIQESLSSPLEWTWKHSDKESDARFTIGDRKGWVWFTKQSNRWLCGFEIDGADEITGGGDAFVIMSTVIRVIEDFVKSRKPLRIQFDAKESEASRVRLYSKLANEAGPKLGYRVEEYEENGSITFDLRRK